MSRSLIRAIGVVVLLIGLAVSASFIHAAWFRATQGNDLYQIERFCKDGFTITAAYQILSSIPGDNYPSGPRDHTIYARMYPIAFNMNGPDFWGPGVTPPSPFDILPEPPIVGGGVVTLDLRPTPVDADGIPSFYWGRADLPWSPVFTNDFPYVAVFNGDRWFAGSASESQIEDCILFPPPPTEPPPPDHQPAPPAHRPHHPAPPVEPPVEDHHVAPPEQPPVEDSHAAPAEPVANH
jgi:hypothetical protein